LRVRSIANVGAGGNHENVTPTNPSRVVVVSLFARETLTTEMRWHFTTNVARVQLV
jgi:hypothetical protein